MFLSSSADIAIYGGAAGGGKSYALLLEPMRHFHNPLFKFVVFRRTTTQVRNPGGLWDESIKLYSQFSAHPRNATLEWVFPSGLTGKFAHLEHETSVLDWQGSQIPFIGFDELTHFSAAQFWYMLSRNRSVSSVPGYIRATCNPDSESWVREFIDWWIGEDGYPLIERSGKLRWFVRINDRINWADSKEELHATFGRGPEIQPKSVTFIPSSIYDNKILIDKDPSYIANLQALPRVERLRLLGGNWNVKLTAGSLFQAEWFEIIDAIPGGWINAVRFWDRAATKPNEGNPDPDWTRGLLLFRYPNNTYVVGDIKSMRDTPAKVEDLVKNVASQDSRKITIVSQQDPGSAGVMEAQYFTRMLSGYTVRTVVINKDKINRAKPVSAQVEAGNVKILRAPWNREFLKECEDFPEGAHDDQVDTLSGAFNYLTEGQGVWW